MRRLGPARAAVAAVAVLACVRVAIPVAQLAHADLPGLPRYRWHALTGDATGFYAAAREFIAAWGRVPRVGLAALAVAVVVAAVVLVREWRRRPAWRPWLLVLAVLGAGLVICVDVLEQRATGAAVFGWPLLWALPMLPYRAAGGHLDPRVAFEIGVPLQLACNVVTLVALAVAGFYATGRRWIGVVAAAIWAFWPFLTGLIGGHRAWTNGTWAIDAGLHMYTEPLSTALAATSLALLLSPRLTPLRLAVAGCVLSYATLVKLSNGVLAGVALVWLARRYRSDLRRVLPYVAGVLTLVPLVGAYWPLSYPKLFNNPRSWPQKPFELHYLVRSWTDSLLFTPHTLAIIAPLAVVGILALRRDVAVFLVAWVVANAAFYSFYANTPDHPRFLWASLPPFFLLCGAGVAYVGAQATRLSSAAAARAPT